MYFVWFFFSEYTPSVSKYICNFAMCLLEWLTLIIFFNYWFSVYRWVGDVPFRVRFFRLFDLSENKLLTVSQMFDLGWDERGEAWKWRRRLWAWEEKMLEECITLLLTIMLQVDTIDVWKWIPNPAAGYTVRGAYYTLTCGVPSNHSAPLISANLL